MTRYSPGQSFASTVCTPSISLSAACRLKDLCHSSKPIFSGITTLFNLASGAFFSVLFFLVVFVDFAFLLSVIGIIFL